jgi:hypothetical protein
MHSIFEVPVDDPVLIKILHTLQQLLHQAFDLRREKKSTMYNMHNMTWSAGIIIQVQ